MERVGARTTPQPSGGGPAADLLVASVLAVLTVLLRFPFRSQFLYSWDSANYALAIRDYYNVAHHQPHPPGYPLYVAVASVATRVLGEPNAGLVAISIAASALAVGLLTLLGARLYGVEVGAVAGVVLMLMVGFWGYGEVAYPYTALAALSVLLATTAYAIRAGRTNWVVPSGALLALAAGVRWDAALFALPLWLWAAWRAGLLRILAAGLLGLLVALGWVVPMVQLSGGWDEYWAATRAQSAYVTGTFSVLAGGISRGRSNLEAFFGFLRVVVGPSLAVLVYEVGRYLTPSRLAADGRARFLLLWLLPPTLVYALVHIGDAGYTLSLAPALALLTAVGLADLAAELARALEVLGARLGWRVTRARLGVASRLAVAGVLVGILAWSTNSFVRTPGPARWPEIRQVDAALAASLRFTRQGYAPGETLVLAHDSFRQLRYYLGEYDVRLLFDPYRPDWQTARSVLDLPPGISTVLVFDQVVALDAATAARLRRRPLDEPGGTTVAVVDVEGARAVEIGYRALRVVP